MIIVNSFFICNRRSANIGNFSIRTNGKGGQRGAKEHVIDPILYCISLICDTNKKIADQLDLWSELPAFTFVEMLAEPSFNIIPSNVLLQGTLT